MVRLICCAHDDGAQVVETWAEADAFRESYATSATEALYGRHHRQGIVSRAPDGLAVGAYTERRLTIALAAPTPPTGGERRGMGPPPLPPKVLAPPSGNTDNDAAECLCGTYWPPVSIHTHGCPLGFKQERDAARAALGRVEAETLREVEAPTRRDGQDWSSLERERWADGYTDACDALRAALGDHKGETT